VSLKAFHLLFIGASLVMSLAVGAWSLRAVMAGQDGGTLALGVASLVLGGALAVYATRVWAKFKELPK
jgi:hypothetical protein